MSLKSDFIAYQTYLWGQRPLC